MINDIDKIRRLIAENKTDRALQMLKTEIAAYPDFQNELFTLSAKFNDLRKKEIIGVLDENEALKFHTQINFSILELINEIEVNGSSANENEPQQQQAFKEVKKKAFSCLTIITTPLLLIS